MFLIRKVCNNLSLDFAEEGEYHILDVVRNTVRHLTQCPGEYDFLIGDFTEVLQTMTEKRTMTDFVGILIENVSQYFSLQFTSFHFYTMLN